MPGRSPEKNKAMRQSEGAADQLRSDSARRKRDGSGPGEIRRDPRSYPPSCKGP
jgi:hypothetical protein